jgi:hypothetical protein
LRGAVSGQGRREKRADVKPRGTRSVKGGIPDDGAGGAALDEDTVPVNSVSSSDRLDEQRPCPGAEAPVDEADLSGDAVDEVDRVKRWLAALLARVVPEEEVVALEDAPAAVPGSEAAGLVPVSQEAGVEGRQLESAGQAQVYGAVKYGLCRDLFKYYLVII